MCCCDCCSATQRKAWVYGFGTIFVVLGIVMVCIWPNVSQDILIRNFVLEEGSENFDSWVEAPIPIYLEFYLFNWTNPEDIRNPNIKPNFVEMGPYVYLEKHKKDNLTFYPNNTVSYYERRTWFFDAERSNGTEDDMVTAAHVITAAVADEMRHANKITKKIVNFMLNREGGMLYTTQKAVEWIFYGYQDNLTDFLNLFNTTKINIPYTRFGWLADRNESLEYDGRFTVHTGVGDIMKLGELSHWNGKSETGYYPMPCGKINGTTGDVFHPRLDRNGEITIFATDACRFMNLKPNGTMNYYDLEGVVWIATEETLDSGENYPDQQCFCNPAHGECAKTGVVECKICRGAPIYTSFPHFFLADESYRNAVSGLSPSEEKHRFTMAVEPNLGVPLKVNARLQINMMIEPDNDYDIYRGVQKVLMPMFWFEQKAYLSEELAHTTKLANGLEDYGRYFGIALIVFGAIFFIVGIILTLTKSWKRSPPEDEDILTN